MRLVAVNSARADYFDRNPTKVSKTGLSAPGAAAEALTTRGTYTVPAGKKAYLELIFIRSRESANVALDGAVIGTFQVTPSGGSLNTLLSSILEIGEKGVSKENSLGFSAVLSAGDLAELTTQVVNAAAGTNVSIRVSMFGTEFDA